MAVGKEWQRGAGNWEMWLGGVSDTRSVVLQAQVEKIMKNDKQMSRNTR